jgi:hypothetical protein
MRVMMVVMAVRQHETSTYVWRGMESNGKIESRQSNSRMANACGGSREEAAGNDLRSKSPP